MNRRFFLTTTAVTAVAAVSGAPLRAQEPLKIGFIYVGPVGDMGWSYQHDQSRQAAEKALDGKVVTTYIESVPEGPDAERALTQLALQGNKLIFATSFGYMDAVQNVAKKFPDVKFEHATGYKRAENVGTYDARFYESRAVQGVLAGLMTKTNKIGYIGSFPIPECVQGVNAAFIAAREVNPQVEMKVVWAYTWFDPAKEADAAAALIAEGCDVIMQHTDSTAPQAKAQEAGNIYTFGQASDMSAFAPMPRIASTIDNWAPYYTKRFQDAVNGTWESDATWGGIDSGMVEVGEITSAVPDDVKARALAMKDKIAAGYSIFTGPLNKQDGSEWLADDEVADDATIAGMNFYVEGIKADLPK